VAAKNVTSALPVQPRTNPPSLALKKREMMHTESNETRGKAGTYRQFSGAAAGCGTLRVDVDEIR
jgi:hypothetical protein